ncbi:TetR family transcriptional regulator [Escherichia coli]|uniref:TetR family transcriptional regulator n=1 Tax=Escherichia coli TaxID=562 RepID=A0A377BAX9_ECOLX|nr:TetR family transcriptional regulator [Escherichia coli]
MCDLSEDMRSAMDKGARGVIALLSQALENGRENHCLTFCGEPLQQAQVLYALWLWRESAGQNFAQFRATGKRAGPCKKHYCDACRFSRHFLSPDDREPLCHLKNCIPH